VRHADIANGLRWTSRAESVCTRQQAFTHVKALLNAVPKRDLCHRQATASKARIVITWRSAQDQQAAKAHRRQKQGRDNHHTTAA
jgi:hypothetical protein